MRSRLTPWWPLALPCLYLSSACGRLAYEPIDAPREPEDGEVSEDAALGDVPLPRRPVFDAEPRDVPAPDADRRDAPLRDVPLVDVGALDAPPGPCMNAECLAAGGSCVGTVCEIVQTSEAPVTCPPGMPCRVLCVGAARPCRDGVDCGAASSCEVRCIGDRACEQGVQCRDSACTVTCSGDRTCDLGITTGPSGTCTSHCCLGACASGVGTCTNDAVCL